MITIKKKGNGKYRLDTPSKLIITDDMETIIGQIRVELGMRDPEESRSMEEPCRSVSSTTR